MWNPEIEVAGSHRAKVYGLHRSFCMASTIYRGTPEDPGVVLGLDVGGCVTGVAFKLVARQREKSLDVLYAREMLLNIYVPTIVSVHLIQEDKRVKALTFVANRKHPSYARLSDDEVIQRFKRCVGQRGPNLDYARKTYAALQELGVEDAHFKRLIARL
jgi:glutathione-specific gamma-glutamylcyclotransferase